MTQCLQNSKISHNIRSEDLMLDEVGASTLLYKVSSIFRNIIRAVLISKVFIMSGGIS